MPIVELEEYIFQIDCIQKKNYHQNSNYSYLYKNSNDLYTYSKTVIIAIKVKKMLIIGMGIKRNLVNQSFCYFESVF
jgi:hypothetical protein